MSNIARKDSSQKSYSLKERLIFGGNIGGSLGTYSYFQINPLVGYRITDRLGAGVGFNYIYSGSRGYAQHVYGPSAWSRFYPMKNIILHTEFEYLTMSLRTPTQTTYSANAPVWLVGGGYQTSGSKLNFGILILYDLIQDPQSPYSNPILRVGGMIGF